MPLLMKNRFAIPVALTISAGISWIIAARQSTATNGSPSVTLSDTKANTSTQPTDGVGTFRIRRSSARVLTGRGLVDMQLDENGNCRPDFAKLFEGGLPFTFYAENRVLFIDATISDTVQRAKMKRLEIVDPPGDWDINQDKDSLEVVDATGQPIFQITKVDDLTFSLSGCFTDDGGQFVVIRDNVWSKVKDPLVAKQQIAALKPIFKHPATRFKGQRVMFFVKAWTRIVRHQKDGGGQHFLFVSNATSEGIWAASMFLAQCTNTGDKSIMIDSFSIEALSESGKWQNMPVLMNPERGDLYLLTTPADAVQMIFDQGSFSSAAHAKNIAPGETIQGWICVAYGKENFADQLRIRIFDTSGNEHLIGIQPPPEVAPPSAQAQKASYSTTKPTIDIAKIPITN